MHMLSMNIFRELSSTFPWNKTHSFTLEIFSVLFLLNWNLERRHILLKWMNGAQHWHWTKRGKDTALCPPSLFLIETKNGIKALLYGVCRVPDKCWFLTWMSCLCPLGTLSHVRSSQEWVWCWELWWRQYQHCPSMNSNCLLNKLHEQTIWKCLSPDNTSKWRIKGLLGAGEWWLDSKIEEF